ncbi:hypothetical protein NXT3_CH00098 [Sinorhizobium fredii]|uniref:Uncharacterized protein n=1 Tax=Rhizobium fredii TaxID=380 RepID=A0A2L0GZV6_RHIFR|nr:hypothetical protein NXT3_CH00098 [Sinorhizobium fredii]
MQLLGAADSLVEISLISTRLRCSSPANACMFLRNRTAQAKAGGAVGGNVSRRNVRIFPAFHMGFVSDNR